jgi:predicted dehydrogenase
MTELNRRKFIARTGAAFAAASIGVNAFGAPRVLGANERLSVACAGIRGRGRDHIGGFSAVRNCEVVALCDADENVLRERAKEVADRGTVSVSSYIDVREMLEDRDIHILSIASPNHWHSLMGIWACQAGKDVYVEKPCSHNVFEGRKLVEAATKYQRIVQHGTQVRSSESIREAMQLLRDGVIGEVYMARGLCYKRRNTIGKTPDAEPPKGVHYDLWLGPAPKRAFSQNRFHYNWHWNWEYGNGDIGNQGVHQMDLARWGLGVRLPKLVSSMGGHFMFDDDQETPNVQIATFQYPEERKLLVFEVRHWHTNDESEASVGVLFYGSEGYMVIPSYSGYKTYLGPKREPGPKGDRGGNHYENFVNAVLSRDASKLNAPVEEGHYSSALCHLANASYRLGRSFEFDPTTETSPDADAQALLTREYRDGFAVPREV